MAAARRRDRHGRRLRGALLPQRAQVGATEVVLPAWRSRAEGFDDLVQRAVDDLLLGWREELRDVEFAVEEVPTAVTGLEDGLVADETAGGPVLLGQLFAAEGSGPARLVVYRRPLEARAEGRTDLADLVHEVLVELVAQLLGLDPDVIDPPG